MGATTDGPASQVVAVIAERSTARARAEADAVAGRVDVVEWRLDHLEAPPDFEAFLDGLGLPVIATCRRPEDGGRWTGDEAARLRLLAAAGKAGCDWLDVECGVRLDGDRGDAGLIRSLHLASGSEETPADGLARLEEEKGGVLKLVFPVDDAPAALDALRLLAGRSAGARPLAVMAAGPRGVFTRLLGPVFGSAFVYAASRRGREVVPGMPTVSDLDRVHGLRRVGRGAPWYALLGRTLRHSVSPHTMNAALRAAGRPDLYVAVPCEDGTATARGLLELGARGLAFTAPFKGVPIDLADRCLPPAGRAGAANTLLREGTDLVAANTDATAALALAREALGRVESDTAALVLGSGGTARAVAAALVEAGATVHIAGRDPQRTAAAAAAAGAIAGVSDGPVDLLFNATPVGQWPGPRDDPAARLAPHVEARVRFDAVYNPRRTAFLEAARTRSVDGFSMLVEQGVRQLEAWGVPSPDAGVMRGAGEAALARIERRVVLIGMRGCGKSAVGEALARATGRPLLDTDRMVEEETGRRIYDIFREDGESAFRDLERDAVARALRAPGTIVALGGGAVQHLAERPPDADVVWLTARPETLGRRLRASGRPSLTGRPPEEEVVELIRARDPEYHRLATLRIPSDEDTPGEVAAAIAEALGL